MALALESLGERAQVCGSRVDERAVTIEDQSAEGFGKRKRHAGIFAQDVRACVRATMVLCGDANAAALQGSDQVKNRPQQLRSLMDDGCRGEQGDVQRG